MLIKKLIFLLIINIIINNSFAESIVDLNEKNKSLIRRQIWKTCRENVVKNLDKKERLAAIKECVEEKIINLNYF